MQLVANFLNLFFITAPELSSLKACSSFYLHPHKPQNIAVSAAIIINETTVINHALGVSDARLVEFFKGAIEDSKIFALIY